MAPDKGKAGRKTVGIAELKTASRGEVLVTLGLGSCVVVALYDGKTGIGALAHVMLPDKACGRRREGENMLKYADEAVPAAVRAVEKMGARRPSLRAKIAGGSRMFDLGKEDQPDIGLRNVEAVRKILADMGIPLTAEDTGGRRGRSVEFRTETGLLLIRTIHGGEKQI